jgi:hypothetical protein
MTQNAICKNQLGPTSQSLTAGTAGIDVAGMFGCLADKTTGTGNCPYHEINDACGTSNCKAFTVTSDDKNLLTLQACDSSGLLINKTLSNAVAFAPFGNNIATTSQSFGQKAAKRKLPGWD